MTAPSLPPPAWVCKRDGRLVPFEADKISQALFAVTERLGRPDAFLARELADGIVHFLAAEADGQTPTTAQVADLVVKVVRELGQPALAAAFAEGQRTKDKRQKVTTSTDLPEGVIRFSPHDSPAAVVRRCLRQHTLHTVFSRDLAAAQDEGLLTLTGLEAAGELAGCVLALPPARSGLLEAILAARGLASRFVAIDGPEHLLAHATASETAIPDYLRALEIGLRAAGLWAVVNLNSTVKPAWADDLADGPLFAGLRRANDPNRLAALADALREQVLESKELAGLVRIDWHLGEEDFRPAARDWLQRVARRAVEGAGLAFVLDRPRRPIPLAEGIDRQHPAVLLIVGLHLPRLAEQPGIHGDPDRFVQKLGSLARLALSAAIQKRDFLRRLARPGLTCGFLLDRARLVAVPVGLECTVQALTGRSLCTTGPALDLARQVVRRLHDVLLQEGQAYRLATCLDGSAVSHLGEPEPAGEAYGPANVAGLTPWDAAAAIKEQLRAAGVLHAIAGGGTAMVRLPEDGSLTANQITDWLQWTWKQTEVVRLRFTRAAVEHRQLTLRMADVR